MQPFAWLSRVFSAQQSLLGPRQRPHRFSVARTLLTYVSKVYLPAAQPFLFPARPKSSKCGFQRGWDDRTRSHIAPRCANIQRNARRGQLL